MLPGDSAQTRRSSVHPVLKGFQFWVQCRECSSAAQECYHSPTLPPHALTVVTHRIRMRLTRCSSPISPFSHEPQAFARPCRRSPRSADWLIDRFARAFTVAFFIHFSSGLWTQLSNPDPPQAPYRIPSKVSWPRRATLRPRKVGTTSMYALTRML